MTPPAAPGEAPTRAHADPNPNATTGPSGGPEASRGEPAGASPGETEAAADSARVVLDDASIRRALMRISHEIVESADGTDHLYLVSIPNGGVPLGRLLAQNLERLTGTAPPLGILDTTLYRDDLATRGARPKLRATEMPSSVDDRVVILVEDVVSTGRTIRAAMDALMDFGRPSHVRVVALVDRGHRELPIKIDYVGKNIPTQPADKVVFRADDVDAGADETVGALQISVREGARASSVTESTNGGGASS